MLYEAKIESITGHKIKRLTRLTGGMIGDVFRVDLVNGDIIVAKVSDNPRMTLDVEGRMLQYLKDHSKLPVPDVIHNEGQLLLLTFIPNNGGIDTSVERDAAKHLAELHNVSSQKFGLDFDNLIGSIYQPNPQMDSWIDFYREHRLLYMADIAVKSGQLPKDVRKRIDVLAPKLDNLLSEPEKPALIHGDMWAGNVLVEDARIAGFVDPATYYAHAEMELAYIALFGTFGQTFFSEYSNLRSIEAGFFETRRHIYGLYHLLVHVEIFGGGYVHQTDSVVRRFVE
jgi:fructosamine-3-kinase